MAISRIQNTNIQYSCNIVQKDNFYVSVPVFAEPIPCNASPAHKRYLEEKDLSKREQLKNGIERIVEETGLSKKYIDLLINEEKLRLKVYDDGVKNDNSEAHGTYSIGIGHTGAVPGWMFQDESFENDKLYEITAENKDLLTINATMAMELLAEDLKDAKTKAIDFFGEENFNNAPQSIKNSIVDIIFNKGLKAFDEEKNPNSPTIKLKEDLENKDYVSAAAHTIYETPVLGLKMRNLSRFAHSVKDLSFEEKQAAKEMVSEYYETVTKDIRSAKLQASVHFSDYFKWLKYNWIEAKANMIWNSIDIPASNTQYDITLL